MRAEATCPGLQPNRLSRAHRLLTWQTYCCFYHTPLRSALQNLCQANWALKLLAAEATRRKLLLCELLNTSPGRFGDVFGRNPIVNETQVRTGIVPSLQLSCSFADDRQRNFRCQFCCIKFHRVSWFETRAASLRTQMVQGRYVTPTIY